MQLAAIVSLYAGFKEYLFAYLMALPRAYAFIVASQLLNPSVVPRLARNAAILIMAMPLVPALVAAGAGPGQNVALFMVYFGKEFFLGFILGYLLFWMFWAVQTAGTLIDNQRGTAIASSIDPLQGHEASPLGILFSQAFVTYFFSLGGFLVLIGLLYDSYSIWPVTQMLPITDAAFPKLIFAVIDRGVMLCVLLSAPVVIIMFLAEFSLALVSRFAPQVQVFVLAMPIKSGIAMLIMIFYLPIMMGHAVGEQATINRFFDQFYEILRQGAAHP